MNCGKKLSYTCRRAQLCLTLLYSGKIVLQVEIGSTFKIIIASFFHFFKYQCLSESKFRLNSLRANKISVYAT